MTPEDDDLTPTFAATLAVAVLAVVLALLVWWAGVRDEAGITQAEVSPATTVTAVGRVETPEDDAGPSSSGETDTAWIGWRADLWAGVVAAAPELEVEVSSIAIERQPSGEVVITNPPEAPVAAVPVGELEELICSYDWDCATALRVANCESTMRPDAVSPGGDMGLMQVNPVHRGRVADMGYAWDQLLDPHVNLAVAWSIYTDAGHSWSPWTCARKVGLG